MKKKIAEKPKRKRGHKRQRKNQAFGGSYSLPPFAFPPDSLFPIGGPIDISAPGFDGMDRMAADLMIQAALVGASVAEKMMLGIAIPMFLQLIRKMPGTVDTSKLFADEMPGEAKQ